MPSPFPGMNPYLEQEAVWHDFHERFIPLAAEWLNAQVGADYIVRIDEHIYIHELPDTTRQLAGRADIAVATTSAPAELGSAVGLLEAPVQVRLPVVDVERDAKFIYDGAPARVLSDSEAAWVRQFVPPSV